MHKLDIMRGYYDMTAEQLLILLLHSCYLNNNENIIILL